MPLYMGLARRLSEGLQRGQWQAEGALPSERVLAELLAVSRDTARKALGLLCQRGLLVRVRGSGTYRAAPVATGQLQQVRAVAATALQAAQMGIPPGTALLYVQRLRDGPGGMPPEIEHCYLHGAEAGLCIELHLADAMPTSAAFSPAAPDRPAPPPTPPV